MRKVRDSEHEESEHEESESEQRERRVWKRSGREGRVRERTGEHHQLRHQSPPPRPTRKGPHARAHTQRAGTRIQGGWRLLRVAPCCPSHPQPPTLQFVVCQRRLGDAFVRVHGSCIMVE